MRAGDRHSASRSRDLRRGRSPPHLRRRRGARVRDRLGRPARQRQFHASARRAGARAAASSGGVASRPVLRPRAHAEHARDHLRPRAGAGDEQRLADRMVASPASSPGARTRLAAGRCSSAARRSRLGRRAAERRAERAFDLDKALDSASVRAARAADAAVLASTIAIERHVAVGVALVIDRAGLALTLPPRARATASKGAGDAARRRRPVQRAASAGMPRRQRPAGSTTNASRRARARRRHHSPGGRRPPVRPRRSFKGRIDEADRRGSAAPVISRAWARARLARASSWTPRRRQRTRACAACAIPQRGDLLAARHRHDRVELLDASRARGSPPSPRRSREQRQPPATCAPRPSAMRPASNSPARAARRALLSPSRRCRARLRAASVAVAVVAIGAGRRRATWWFSENRAGAPPNARRSRARARFADAGRSGDRAGRRRRCCCARRHGARQHADVGGRRLAPRVPVTGVLGASSPRARGAAPPPARSRRGRTRGPRAVRAHASSTTVEFGAPARRRHEAPRSPATPWCCRASAWIPRRAGVGLGHVDPLNRRARSRPAVALDDPDVGAAA